MQRQTDKTGYALKVEQGNRPLLYSAEHADWKSAVLRKDDRATAAADIAWRRKFRPIVQRVAA